MPNSQDFDHPTNSTLTKLLEVDSQLAVTETELLSQLESIREKRRSLKTVISLFTTADMPTNTPIESPAPPAQTLSTETSKAIKPVGSDLTTQPIDASSATTTKSLQNEALPNTESNGAKKTASSPTKRNKTMQSMHPVKTANTASEWHQYLREEFSNTPLSSAVSLVLQHQAERVFEIPAIVSAIFVDELPKEIGTKARRQVTNILSSGAMKNKWYRGQQGYYSMSRAAVKGSSS